MATIEQSLSNKMLGILAIVRQVTIVGDLFLCRLQLLTDHVFRLVLSASSFVRQPTTVTSSGVARVVGI